MICQTYQTKEKNNIIFFYRTLITNFTIPDIILSVFKAPVKCY